MIDKKRRRHFDQYMDEAFPPAKCGRHPFLQFEYSEIVRHPEHGYGIVTGFRMPDLDREITGLGVQFVENGVMKDHRVFSAAETGILERTGIVFDSKKHAGETLENLAVNSDSTL
ncbi:hypothetical protein JXA40_11955 [bacterium]|nr:hypothetical protein [candidate division CSSED10-310 bacterium]